MNFEGKKCSTIKVPLYNLCIFVTYIVQVVLFPGLPEAEPLFPGFDDGQVSGLSVPGHVGGVLTAAPLHAAAATAQIIRTRNVQKILQLD